MKCSKIQIKKQTQQKQRTQEALACNYYGCVAVLMWIQRLLSYNGESHLQPGLWWCNAIITSQRERYALTRQVMAAITGAEFHTQ